MQTGDEALNLKQSVKLPQTIVLPLKIVSALGIGRRLNLNDAQQVVPVAVKSWMQADKRYGAWFASESEPAAAVIAKKVGGAKTNAKKVAPPAPAKHKQVKSAEGEGDGKDGAETPAANQSGGSEGDPAGDPKEAAGAANRTPTAESWAINMNVPDLREYAKRNGVVLDQDGKKDLKDDILAKLRAAKLPERETP